MQQNNELIIQANYMDFAAKDIEKIFKGRRGHEFLERRRRAFELRLGAARIYEEFGRFHTAAFSYSKAAKHAFWIYGIDVDIEIRASAVRCIESALDAMNETYAEEHGLSSGELSMERRKTEEDSAYNLLFYGELLIRKGFLETVPERQNYMIGLGMNAIEESKERFKRTEVQKNPGCLQADEYYDPALGHMGKRFDIAYEGGYSQIGPRKTEVSTSPQNNSEQKLPQS